MFGSKDNTQDITAEIIEKVRQTDQQQKLENERKESIDSVIDVLEDMVDMPREQIESLAREVAEKHENGPETHPESIDSGTNWYDHDWKVVLLLIFFFPLGLYGLWKSPHFKKPTKIIIFITYFIGLVGSLLNNPT
ncbi:hypothetical protein [Desulfoluna butyratoxydans]|uniref:Uncharacterized protein n=1 Tax=Desulfoluna butyratoxydans TaxID=231438 RepID=A0A4U8YYB9_9BACT|nr:hypothetical protein [Desulfoluna butyratoxydans]VFQ47122.1 hypothetical protein MSL71_48080 [Desulfoluna butyratoxydans]